MRRVILAYLCAKKYANMSKTSAEKICYFEVRSKATRIVIAKQPKHSSMDRAIDLGNIDEEEQKCERALLERLAKVLEDLQNLED
jgi:hypothetical protein